MENRGWYSEITLLHCLGVLMIFFGHVAQRIGQNVLGELLITGVPLFLFVSGFLAGNREVAYNQDWFKRKARRILVPYYMVVIPVLCIFTLMGGAILFIQWFVLLTNLQGLTNFLFMNDLTGYWAPLNQGLGHFWFVTIIMLCYLLVPGLNAVYRQLPWLRKNIWSVLLAIVFVVEPMLLFYNIKIGYIVLFFIGFFFACKKVEITHCLFFFSMVVFAFLIVMRLVSRTWLDDTVIYNHYISGLASTAVGLGIVAVFFYLRKLRPAFVDRVAKMKAIVWLDSIIYEVFLIHHIFIKGSWSVFSVVNNIWAGTALVLFITLVASVIVHRISNRIITILKK